MDDYYLIKKIISYISKSKIICYECDKPCINYNIIKIKILSKEKSYYICDNCDVFWDKNWIKYYKEKLR